MICFEFLLCRIDKTESRALRHGSFATREHFTVLLGATQECAARTLGSIHVAPDCDWPEAIEMKMDDVTLLQ
jgi:hypothetical protein